MATFIIGTIVIGAFVAVAIGTYRKKKKTGSCCSSCKGCANSPYCHGNK